MIDPAAAPRAAQSSGSGTQNPGAILKNDDFLRLLITQLKNQDPPNPLDQNEFLGHTTQFTSLEQLQSINRGLAELKNAAAGASMAQAATLLGKTARVSGRDFQFDGVRPAALGFMLEAPAGDVAVEVVDQQGSVLRRLTTGPLDAGAHTVQWDGLDGDGRQVAAGGYFYRVSSASAAAGSPPLVLEGELTGFERRGADFLYRIGTALVRPEDVLRVR
jgi:flagellar basal-body rod modification protein FlgD